MDIQPRCWWLKGLWCLKLIHVDKCVPSSQVSTQGIFTNTSQASFTGNMAVAEWLPWCQWCRHGGYQSPFNKHGLPSSLLYKTHLSRQLNCRSLGCSWSIACRRCSNYIFILDLTPGFNSLGRDNCKMRRLSFKLWDSVRLILEILL